MRLVDTRQYLRDGLLYPAINDRRDAQLPSSPVRLGDVYPPHRLGTVLALEQAFPRGLSLMACLSIRQGLSNRLSIDPCRALVALHC